jgi:hypothetical protein
MHWIRQGDSAVRRDRVELVAVTHGTNADRATVKQAALAHTAPRALLHRSGAELIG